jgi:hypothetical protein
MANPNFYRSQAQRCLMLSRSTTEPRTRLWLTDLATLYFGRANASYEGAEETTGRVAAGAPERPPPR